MLCLSFYTWVQLTSAHTEFVVFFLSSLCAKTLWSSPWPVVMSASPSGRPVWSTTPFSDCPRNPKQYKKPCCSVRAPALDIGMVPSLTFVCVFISTFLSCAPLFSFLVLFHVFVCSYPIFVIAFMVLLFCTSMTITVILYDSGRTQKQLLECMGSGEKKHSHFDRSDLLDVRYQYNGFIYWHE